MTVVAVERIDLMAAAVDAVVVVVADWLILAAVDFCPIVRLAVETDSVDEIVQPKVAAITALIHSSLDLVALSNLVRSLAADMLIGLDQPFVVAVLVNCYVIVLIVVREVMALGVD